jgi:hypothetical protein
MLIGEELKKLSIRLIKKTLAVSLVILNENTIFKR